MATNDAVLAAEMAALRQYGWKERYISARTGINSRLDPVQAAILAVQLKHLNVDNAVRKRIATIYTTELAGCGLILPTTASWAEHAFHLYVIQCSNRTGFTAFLRERGVGTAVHYPAPVHMQPAYENRMLLAPGGLSVTESITDRIVSLPMFPQLSHDDVARVCSAARQWAKTHN